MATRIFAPIRYALCTSWPTALLIVTVSAAAIGASSAVNSLGRRGAPLAARLESQPPVRSDLGVAWTEDARSPAELARVATGELLGLLLLAGWGVIGVAAISVLAIGAARAAGRRTDVQVRRAVGASRVDLLLGASAEGAVITAAAASAGAAIGGLGARYAATTWPGLPASWHGPTLVVVSVLAGVVFATGLFPLVHARARRVSVVPDSPPSLGLAALALALSLTILVAGSVLRAGARGVMGSSGPIASAPRGLVYSLDLAGTPFAGRARLYGEVLGRLSRDPAVGRASLSSPGTLLGLGTVDHLETDCGNCFVGGIFLKFRFVRAAHHSATADTFHARGARLMEGRSFTAADTLGAGGVAVVNRYLAARFFEDGRAVGRELWLGSRMSGEAYRVIGVVDDDRPQAVGGGVAPLEAVYLSALQHPADRAELWIEPRAGAPPGLPASLARISLGSVAGPVSLARLREREAGVVGWFGRWFRVLGWVTLGLATVASFALMQLWVRAMSSELALRRAVGAGRGRVIGVVLARAIGMAAQGIGLALLMFAPFLWGEILRIVPGAPPPTAGTVASYATLLLAAAALGALVPAVGAIRRPPVVDLSLAAP